MTALDAWRFAWPIVTAALSLYAIFRVGVLVGMARAAHILGVRPPR